MKNDKEILTVLNHKRQRKSNLSLFDNIIYPNMNDFIGNRITDFYYGMKGTLKIFKGSELLKTGKRLDTTI